MGKSKSNLAEKFPQLALEWHPTLNEVLTPCAVSPSGRMKVWWQCKQCNETFEASLNNRSRGRGCPSCAGKRSNSNNNLEANFPELAKQWHEKNELKAKDVVSKSHKKVWWKCKEGHEWEAVINNRTSCGNGCPYCSGRLPTKTSSLGFLRPDLVKEWHPIKNKVTPYEVTQFSHKSVWWRCEHGHEWKADVANRTNIGSGCPYCSGNLATEDNNLTKTHPLIVNQWHPIKNGELDPKNFSHGSGYSVWWICSRGHEWKALINNRARGVGCPHCLKSGSSFPEIILWSELSHLYGKDNVLHRHRDFGFEIDVFITPLNVGIEYDGYYWHSNRKKRKRDAWKYQKTKELGIRLVRITTVDKPPKADCVIKSCGITKDTMNKVVEYLATIDNNTTSKHYKKHPQLLSVERGLR
jgi:hypothetical protein